MEPALDAKRIREAARLAPPVKILVPEPETGYKPKKNQISDAKRRLTVQVKKEKLNFSLEDALKKYGKILGPNFVKHRYDQLTYPESWNYPKQTLIFASQKKAAGQKPPAQEKTDLQKE